MFLSQDAIKKGITAQLKGSASRSGRGSDRPSISGFQRPFQCPPRAAIQADIRARLSKLRHPSGLEDQSLDFGTGAPVANGVADMERSPAINLNPEPRKIGGVPLAGIPAVLRLNTNDQIDGTGLQKGKSGSQTNPWAVLLRMGGESARLPPPPRRPAAPVTYS